MKKISCLINIVLLFSAFSYAETTWKDLSKEINNRIESADLGRHSIETDFKSPGEIIISGYVASGEDKQLVEDRLSVIKGVKTVQNQLVVKPEVARLPSDSEKKLNEAVKKNVADKLIEKKYSLSLENLNNELVLKGMAQDTDTISQIYSIAKATKGVGKVTNLMKVETKLSDPELVERVKKAFSEEDDLESEDIQITANYGTVTLTGKKRNHRVIDRILSIVQMVDGVEKTISQIEVEEKK